jgi:hypothetical protein
MPERINRKRENIERRIRRRSEAMADKHRTPNIEWGKAGMKWVVTRLQGLKRYIGGTRAAVEVLGQGKDWGNIEPRTSNLEP